MQGLVNDDTRFIVSEYLELFPNIEIVLSTWTSEKTDDIPCKVIKSTPPKIMPPHTNSHNYQIVGTLAGLNSIDAEIILKCRTEQIIHNPNIFELFENECPTSKIMIPNLGTYEVPEYRTSDFCQIATKKLLLEFWNSIPLHDGSFSIDGGTYFTKNFILNTKKDKNIWKNILYKYFFIKDFCFDFQIEWLKLNNSLQYQKNYYNFFPKCVENNLSND